MSDSQTEVDFLSTSTVKLTMQFVQENQPTLDISNGTGFFWKEEDQVYLITNWHNVTGKHFESGELLHSKGAMPLQVALTLIAKGIQFCRAGA